MSTEKSIVKTDEYKYDRMEGYGVDGKKIRSLNNGDAISRALFGLSIEKLKAVMKSNGMGEWLKTANLKNPGQFRMTAGNKLRAKVRRGDPVTVGTFVIKTLAQRSPTVKEALEVNVPAAPAAKKKSKTKAK